MTCNGGGISQKNPRSKMMSGKNDMFFIPVREFPYLKEQNPGMLMILFVANEKGRHLVMVKITTCTTMSTFMGVVDGCDTSDRS